MMMDLTGKNVNGWIVDNRVNGNTIFTFYTGIFEELE